MTVQQYSNLCKLTMAKYDHGVSPILLPKDVWRKLVTALAEYGGGHDPETYDPQYLKWGSSVLLPKRDIITP